MASHEVRTGELDADSFSAESKQGATEILQLLLEEKSAAESKFREFLAGKNKNEYVKQRNGTSVLIEKVFTTDLSETEQRITQHIIAVISTKRGSFEAFRYMNELYPGTSLQALAYMTLEAAAESVLGVKSRLSGDVLKIKHPFT